MTVKRSRTSSRYGFLYGSDDLFLLGMYSCSSTGLKGTGVKEQLRALSEHPTIEGLFGDHGRNFRADRQFDRLMDDDHLVGLLTDSMIVSPSRVAASEDRRPPR